MDWETIITNDLKMGSGFCEGKKRIYQAFIDGENMEKFLAKEYGVGGRTLDNGFWQKHDGKGLEYECWAKGAKIALKWREIASRIEALIDSGEYFTEKEKIKYGIALNERWDGQVLMAI